MVLITCILLNHYHQSYGDEHKNTFYSVITSGQKCSGLKVKIKKSEAIWIGVLSNFRQKPFGRKWTQVAKCLGISISNDLK
jgi:hypothetical protein